MDVREAKLLRQLSDSEPCRLLFRRSSRVIAPPPSQVTPNHAHTGALVFQLVREVHASPPNALYTHISESDCGSAVGSAVGASVVGAAVVGASVVGASVVGASVVGASVVGASVVGASVVGASVVGASVVGASVVGASVVGSAVTRSYFLQKHRNIFTSDAQ
jgi:hypothetical protein